MAKGALPVFQFTPLDIESALEDGDPLWIIVFSNGHCVSSSVPSMRLGRFKKYMDLTHLIATHRIDLDDYVATYPETIDSIDEE